MCVYVYIISCFRENTKYLDNNYSWAAIYRWGYSECGQ